MPDPGRGVHVDHDLELLAALADRSIDPTARARAEALVERCPDCRAIADDLRSLTASLATMPTSRPAPRDMRLSPAVAARARRGAGLRRVLRPFGRAAWAPLRPVGGSLAALGLAGILITATGGALGPSAASAPAAGGAFGANPESSLGSKVVEQNPSGPSAEANDAARGSSVPSGPAGPQVGLGLASPAPTTVPVAAENGTATAAPSAISDRTSGSLAAAPGLTGPAEGGAASAAGIPPLTLVSIAVLAAGLVMLGLRVAGRRVA